MRSPSGRTSVLSRRVWLPRDGLWVAALQLDDTDEGDELTLCVEGDGEIVTMPSSTELFRRNEEGHDSPADLATLAHLDAPSIIHALAERFKLNEIYTWTGSVLIAVNPWKRLPELYSAEALEVYHPDRALPADETLAPHPFAIAAAAYKGLQQGKRQSVLVSGEVSGKHAIPSLHACSRFCRTGRRGPMLQLVCCACLLCFSPERTKALTPARRVAAQSGAGKTETTKVLMQFLSALSGNKKGDSVQRVLVECGPGATDVPNETSVGRRAWMKQNVE